MSHVARLQLVVSDQAALADVRAWVEARWSDVEVRTNVVTDAGQVPDTVDGDIVVVAVDAPAALEVTAALRDRPVVLCSGDAIDPADAQAAGADAICAVGCPARVVVGHVAYLAEGEPHERVFVDSRPGRADRTTAQIADTITGWHGQLAGGDGHGERWAGRIRELAAMLRALPGGRDDPLELPVNRAVHAIAPLAGRLADPTSAGRGEVLARLGEVVARWHEDRGNFS